MCIAHTLPMSRKARLQITLDADVARFLADVAWEHRKSKSAFINDFLATLRAADKGRLLRIAP